MQRSKIEWTNYTLNPIKGLCPVDCKDNQGKSYCYARRMYKRFGWNPEIRFDNSCFPEFPDGSRVFVGSTMELFGDWVKSEWITSIFNYTKFSPRVTFIFLTKRPENLIKWSPFPANCWVGVSVCNQDMANESIPLLMNTEAGKRFVSLEPMLGQIDLTKLVFGHYLPKNNPFYVNAFEDRYIFGDEGDIELLKIDWVIIGQQTPVKPATTPKIEWISEIVEACDKAEIPVFLKNNLRNLLPHDSPFWKLTTERIEEDVEFLTGMRHVIHTHTKDSLRQEFPKVK